MITQSIMQVYVVDMRRISDFTSSSFDVVNNFVNVSSTITKKNDVGLKIKRRNNVVN